MNEDAALPAVEAGSWIEIRRRFRAPWQIVFRHWVEAHELAAWFGPVGYDVTDFTVDAVEGGVWKLGLRSPGGDRFTLRGRYLVVEEPELLRFTWELSGGIEAPLATEVHVTLRADEGTTRLTLRQGPFLSSRTREAHRRAWKSTLESLALKLSEDEIE